MAMGTTTVLSTVLPTGPEPAVLKPVIRVQSLPSGKYADQFHVFSVVWDQSTIRWYVDNIQYHSLNIGGLSAFHQPYFFIFNIAVEGDWPGPVGPTTQFPQFMVVDYVRVFQS